MKFELLTETLVNSVEVMMASQITLDANGTTLDPVKLHKTSTHVPLTHLRIRIKHGTLKSFMHQMYTILINCKLIPEDPMCGWEYKYINIHWIKHNNLRIHFKIWLFVDLNIIMWFFITYITHISGCISGFFWRCGSWLKDDLKCLIFCQRQHQ